jgi:hypothetical protein
MANFVSQTLESLGLKAKLKGELSVSPGVSASFVVGESAIGSAGGSSPVTNL